MLEKIEGRRRKRGQRMRCLEGTTDSMDTGLRELWEVLQQSMESQRVRYNSVPEPQPPGPLCASHECMGAELL